MIALVQDGGVTAMGLRASQSMGVDEFLARFGGKTERYELLDGLPIPRSTGTAAHARIVRRVIGALRRQLSGRPWRAVTETPLLVDRATLLIPDVVVAFKSFDQPAAGKQRSRGRGRGPVRRHAGPRPRRQVAEVRDAREPAALRPDRHRTTTGSRRSARQDVARWSYRVYQDGLKGNVALPALDVCLLAAEIYEGIELDRRDGPRT